MAATSRSKRFHLSDAMAHQFSTQVVYGTVSQLYSLEDFRR